MAESNRSSVYSVNLESNAKTEAETTAQAMERLRGELVGGQQAMRGYNEAIRNLKGGGAAASDHLKGLREQMAAMRKQTADAQVEYLKLGGDTSKLRPDKAVPAAPSNNVFRNMGQSLQKIPNLPGTGPVRQFGAALASVGKDAATTTGKIALLSIAAVALTVAVVAAGAAMAIFGAGAAGARRAEAISLEALTQSRHWWGVLARGTTTGKELQQTVDDVSSSVALGRDEIVKHTQSLYAMGLRGQRLKDVLQGVATVASVAGEGQAELYKGLFLTATMAGHSIKAVAGDIEARFGRLARQKMLGLDIQLSKLKENFNHLFDEVNLEPALEGINSVLSMFGKTEIAGSAIRQMMGMMFDPLVQGVAGASPTVRKFIFGMIIGAQEIMITYLELRNSVRDSLEGIGFGKWLAEHSIAVEVGKLAVYGLAAAFAFAAVAATKLAVASLLAAAPWLAIGAAVALVTYGVVKLIGWLTKLGVVSTALKGVASAAGSVWDFAKRGPSMGPAAPPVTDAVPDAPTAPAPPVAAPPVAQAVPEKPAAAQAQAPVRVGTLTVERMGRPETYAEQMATARSEKASPGPKSARGTEEPGHVTRAPRSDNAPREKVRPNLTINLGGIKIEVNAAAGAPPAAAFAEGAGDAQKQFVAMLTGATKELGWT